MTAPSSLLLVCATAVEAQPLLNHYRLQRQHSYHPFPLYRSHNNATWLIESGLGQINAAAAVSALRHSSDAPDYSACLNIGIAGGEQALGSLWQIHRISSAHDSNRAYPQVLSRSKLPSIALCSHAQACSEYQEHTLVDMEGVGFYNSASRFWVNEQIGLLKIISDNSEHTHHQLNKQRIQVLLQQASNQIIDYCEHWRAHSTAEAAYHQMPAGYEDYLQQHRFSEYQTHELKRLLHQWHVFYPQRAPSAVTAACTNSKSVLQTLRNTIADAQPRWTSCS